MAKTLRVPAGRIALRLARLQLSLPVGERVRLNLPVASSERARALVTGAGFEPLRVSPLFPYQERGPEQGRRRAGRRIVLCQRLRSLPDWLTRDLDLLICGLNPSLHSADAGVPFARPGNRFWPAALRAGLVELDRDPFAAIERGVGFTDCTKRATRAASELEDRDYAEGLARLEDVVRRYRPRAICFVGLAGWRCAIDRHAQAGWTAGGFAATPAYLMPSTSGLNAHSRLDDLSTHLARAAAPPGRLDFAPRAR